MSAASIGLAQEEAGETGIATDEADLGASCPLADKESSNQIRGSPLAPSSSLPSPLGTPHHTAVARPPPQLEMSGGLGSSVPPLRRPSAAEAPTIGTARASCPSVAMHQTSQQALPDRARSAAALFVDDNATVERSRFRTPDCDGLRGTGTDTRVTSSPAAYRDEATTTPQRSSGSIPFQSSPVTAQTAAKRHLEGTRSLPLLGSPGDHSATGPATSQSAGTIPAAVGHDVTSMPAAQALGPSATTATSASTITSSQTRGQSSPPFTSLSGQHSTLLHQQPAATERVLISNVPVPQHQQTSQSGGLARRQSVPAELPRRTLDAARAQSLGCLTGKSERCGSVHAVGEATGVDVAPRERTEAPLQSTTDVVESAVTETAATAELVAAPCTQSTEVGPAEPTTVEALLISSKQESFTDTEASVVPGRPKVMADAPVAPSGRDLESGSEAESRPDSQRSASSNEVVAETRQGPFNDEEAVYPVMVEATSMAPVSGPPPSLVGVSVLRPRDGAAWARRTSHSTGDLSPRPDRPAGSRQQRPHSASGSPLRRPSDPSSALGPSGSGNAKDGSALGKDHVPSTPPIVELDPPGDVLAPDPHGTNADAPDGRPLSYGSDLFDTAGGDDEAAMRAVPPLPPGDEPYYSLDGFDSVGSDDDAGRFDWADLKDPRRSSHRGNRYSYHFDTPPVLSQASLARDNRHTEAEDLLPDRAIFGNDASDFGNGRHSDSVSPSAPSSSRSSRLSSGTLAPPAAVVARGPAEREARVSPRRASSSASMAVSAAAAAPGRAAASTPALTAAFVGTRITGNGRDAPNRPARGSSVSSALVVDAADPAGAYAGRTPVAAAVVAIGDLVEVVGRYLSNPIGPATTSSEAGHSRPSSSRQSVRSRQPSATASAASPAGAARRSILSASPSPMASVAASVRASTPSASPRPAYKTPEPPELTGSRRSTMSLSVDDPVVAPSPPPNAEHGGLEPTVSGAMQPQRRSLSAASILTEPVATGQGAAGKRVGAGAGARAASASSVAAAADAARH
ncbi:hypothetical protein HK405_007261 [Cladochytrium tenue]|nr:hypothetical protein HK405_007261 [Cladochytrium tenue]